MIDKIKSKEINVNNLSSKIIIDAINDSNIDSLLATQAGYLESKLKIPTFFSSLLILLGLAGTLLGLKQSVGGLNIVSSGQYVNNAFQIGITNVFGGLDIAFQTTLLGIIGTVLIRFSLIFFSNEANKLWINYVPIAKKIVQNNLNISISGSFGNSLTQLSSFEGFSNSMKKNIEELFYHQEKLYSRFYDQLTEFNENFRSNIESIINSPHYSKLESHIYDYITRLERISEINLRNSEELTVQQSENLSRFLNEFKEIMHYERQYMEQNQNSQVNYNSNKRSRVTLVTPKYFSKGKDTRIRVYIHTKEFVNFIKKQIDNYNSNVDEEYKLEKEYFRDLDSSLNGKIVHVKVTPEDKLKLDSEHFIELNSNFIELFPTLRPTELADVKNPIPATLLLIDKEKNIDLVQIPFEVKVNDYSVDHIPAYKMNNWLFASSIFLGISIIILESFLQLGINIKVISPIIFVAGTLLKIINHSKYDKLIKAFSS